MASLGAAISFLSRIGLSSSSAHNLMNKLNNDMSCLMVCSNKELLQDDIPINVRLRLLRAIRCFHKEKWSKYLMNNFSDNKNLKCLVLNNHLFEKLIYHLVKYHIWIIYASWTLIYIRKYLIITKNIDQKNIQLFYKKIKKLRNAVIRLKLITIMIKHHLS